MSESDTHIHIEKDPAFLFYSKDWIEGTAELSPAEKGVYIDLLCYQHQRKTLPSDPIRLARLVRLGEAEFLEIWRTVKEKFVQVDDRMVNKRLTKEITERLTKGHRNKIIGTLASTIRLTKAPYHLKQLAKQNFKYEDFLTIPDHLLTESITEWFNKRLKSIEDEDENENEKGIESVREREKTNEGLPPDDKPLNFGNLIIPKMIEIFHANYPNDIPDPVSDPHACQTACQKINKYFKWERDAFLRDKKQETLDFWTKAIEFAKQDSFFVKLPLKSFGQQFENVIKSMNAEKKEINGKHKSVTANNKNAGLNKLLEKGKKFAEFNAARKRDAES